MKYITGANFELLSADNIPFVDIVNVLSYWYVICVGEIEFEIHSWTFEILLFKSLDLLCALHKFHVYYVNKEESTPVFLN